MKKRAIVLSGGGSCGAYEFGVWKALRKMHINYQIVTGTSVGALNGLLMVQNDFRLARKLWSNIDYNFLFENFIKETDKELKKTNIYLRYANNFFKKGGMDISNLELAVNNYFNKKKYNRSKIDFGIMVFNLTKLKSESLTRKNMTDENVKDYIIASATCFPVFKAKNVDSQKYIDGGYGDNLPINLAIDMGAEDIIAIDLGQVGLKRVLNSDNINIKYIKPKNNIGSFLIFDNDQARKNIKYGYNDMLKLYNKLMGDKYTFYKLGYKRFCKKLNCWLEMYKDGLNNVDKNNSIKNIINLVTKKILKIDDLNAHELINIATNTLGNMFSVDDTKIYFIYGFNRLIRNKFKEINNFKTDDIKKKLKNNENKSLLGSKYIVKYIYEKLQASEDGELSILYSLFKNEFLTAIYLLYIGGFNHE